ncbi:DUF4491 family protein [Caproiciproducens sp. CPB-2]|uniref:DUF4491 family protein n=1 Tax=Caproiciproducens sp. CPB-2 TaxID=3030017 RepID=UPI0023D9F5E2|nr:DUF4491 family protein [Caproiciproducens sp. CPB-2]MDF1493164.1 DUF4491 family protein [Caproiciproducens sp. CPB-2]
MHRQISQVKIWRWNRGRILRRIGFCSFLLIGLFHPIVVKAEYYFTKRVFPVFLIVGIACLAAAFFIRNQLASALFGVSKTF